MRIEDLQLNDLEKELLGVIRDISEAGAFGSEIALSVINDIEKQDGPITDLLKKRNEKEGMI